MSSFKPPSRVSSDVKRSCTFIGGSLEDLSSEAASSGPLSELESLVLKRNRNLSELEEAAALASKLTDLSNLKILDASYCQMGKESASKLAPGLRHVPNLKKLVLAHNNLGAKGVEALATEAFPSLVELRELSVESCSLDSAAGLELAGGLCSLVKLEVLHIGGSNEFGPEGMQAIAQKAFPHLAASLSELNCQGLIGLGKAATVKEFGSGLPKLSELCLLDVSRCRLDSSSVPELCSGLAELPKLQTLRLSYNRLGTDGCRSLATGPFRKLATLKSLDISRCGLDANGMKELAPGLGHLSSLESMYFAGNPIDKDGCVALADASSIQRLTNLKEFDVSYCGFGYKQINKLADGLIPLASLQRLILVGNEFGTDGCEVLAEKCLKHLVALRVLDIRNCDIAKPAVEALSPALCDLQDFENLNVGWDKQMSKFIKHLKKARKIRAGENGPVETDAEPDPVRFLKYKQLSLKSSEAGEVTPDLAASLQHFPNIEILSLRGTPIIEKSAKALSLDNSLPLLTNLRELNLSRCSIKQLAMKDLASGLGKLTGLQVLNMQDNELNTQGAEAFAQESLPHLTGLRELILSNCDLEGPSFVALAPGLKNLKELERLIMVGNEISPDGARELANGALPFLVKLRDFNASFCSINAEAMEELSHGLKHLLELEVLILSCNDFAVEGVSVLAKKMFKHTQKLRRLDLQLVECDMTEHPDFDEGFLEEVVPLFSQLTNLQSLQLMGNKLGFQGMQAWTEKVFPHLLQLKELDISYANINEEAMLLFVPALKDLIHMENLNLRNNKFGKEGAKALGSQVLPRMKKLKVLDLRLCGIEEAGVECLFPSIAQLWNLEVVEFGDKSLYLDFLAVLASQTSAGEVAPKLRSFKELKLDGVGLDGDQMIKVAPGLGHMTDLEVLSLRNNELDTEGAAALATALARLTKLRELHISQCKFDDTAIELLAPSLKGLHRLERLNFVGNKFGSDGAKLIASDVLPYLRYLNHISVMDVNVEEEGLTALEEVVLHQAIVEYTGK